MSRNPVMQSISVCYPSNMLHTPLARSMMGVGMAGLARAVGLTCLALLAACGGSGESESVSMTDSAVADAASVEWVLHGNDTGEQRHSSLDQINRANVAQLGLAWSFDLLTDRGVEATPLMVNETLYVSSSWSVVQALDARTGELKWMFDPKVPREFLAKGCCDAVNRGVAYAEGRIVASTYDGRLVALDANTGEVLWDVQTTDREQPYTISGAPRLAGDKVVIGSGGAELGVRGYVTAYDIKTGEQVWRFYTIPGNPEDGFENDAMAKAAETWTGEWWRWGGGGTAWDSMVYDPELNLFYIGVGNGSPWNYKYRSPEGGDNLFLASIVAVNADTGEYVWHYQTTPAETWDFTATQHIMLADLDIDGELRKVLMQAPKNGFFYVLDRVTGELLSAEPYVTTTWATHVDMSTGRPVETPNARLFDGKNVHLPSNAGGHNWPPMAYNPDTGLVYVPTMNVPTQWLEPTASRDMQPQQGYFNQAFDRTPYAPPVVANLPDIIDQTYTGQLLAWDPVKAEPRWVGEMGRVSGGGVLSTAGGLVFQSHHNQFRALDAENGDILWSFDNQSVGMAAPISYALDGKQYIAIAVGFGGGLASEAGPVANHWEVQPNLARVLVFTLDGDAELPPKPEIDRALPEPLPVTATAEVVEQGKALYQRHCSVCHGDGTLTGGLNPDLKRSNPGTHEIWQEIVIGGLLKNAGMVSFAQFLNAEDAEAIRQYVLAQANAWYEVQQAQLTPAEATVTALQ